MQGAAAMNLLPAAVSRAIARRVVADVSVLRTAAPPSIARAVHPLVRAVILPVPLLALVLVSLAAARTGAGRDEASVKVRPAFSPAPATLRVTAVVDTDERNRDLTIEIDSEDFYRSSTTPLQGESGAHVIDMTFRAVPEGDYEIRSTIVRSDGSRITRSSRALVGLLPDGSAVP